MAWSLKPINGKEKSWVNYTVSVLGMFSHLPISSLQALTKADAAGGYRSATGDRRDTEYITDNMLSVNPSDTPLNTWVNAFGFFLYDAETDEFANKILCFRCKTTAYDGSGTAQDRYNWIMQFTWSIFDANSITYTDIFTPWNISVGDGGAWQTELPKFEAFYNINEETYDDVLQPIIYGGFEGKATYVDVRYWNARGMGLPVKSVLEDVYGLTVRPEETDINPALGPESEPDGYDEPSLDPISDPWVNYNLKPGIAQLGLVRLYKCSVGSLLTMGEILFPEIVWPSSASFSDIIEFLASCIQAGFSAIWDKDLIDYIISCHVIPIDVDAAATATDIKVGPKYLEGVTAYRISDDIVTFDCGDLKVPEHYQNFADYLTRCRIYIPFYGFVELKPEFWQSATLNLTYVFNVIDGSFTAQLKSIVDRHQDPCETIVGQYTGCACVHVPLSGADYSSMFSGMISGAAGMAAGIATSNPALAMTSAINAGSSLNGQMQMSNSYNASAAFYGYPRPFLVIERPVSHYPKTYQGENGFPLLVTKRLGDMKGFTIAEGAILDGIPCTQAEKEKIRQMLRSGVIIK